MFHHFILVFCFPEKNIHSQDLRWMCHYRTNPNAKLHITLYTQTESIPWMLQPLGTSTCTSCPKHLEHFASGNPHAPGELPMGWGSLLCLNLLQHFCPTGFSWFCFSTSKGLFSLSHLAAAWHRKFLTEGGKRVAAH